MPKMIGAFHDTTAELSHGNFLKFFEEPRPRLVNVGHRDLFLAPAEIAETFEAVHPAWEVAGDPTRVANELKAKAGAAWDIKAWHKRALDIGGVGLDTLRWALRR